jgi:hypothetical protein
MGFIGGIFGNRANSGLNFRATPTHIEQGVNIGQTGQAYNQTQQGLAQQMDFLQALQGQNGIANQSNVYNQLQGVANGTGPNPALQQLQNTTGQNVANQAALMAGQRGSSANVGLLARQAAQQGGALQQQAVGQGAALQAQQQLAALGQMQGLAGQQVGELAGANQFYNQAAQNEQGNLLGALGQYNNANVAQQNAMNAANAGIAEQKAGSQAGIIGGLLGGLGAAGSAYAGKKAYGGEISSYEEGGNVEEPQSYVGKFLKGNLISPSFDFQGGMPKNYTAGSSKPVPGKASVKGDSLKNDTVPAVLSPGEVVIPRHVMKSNDPVGNAAKFVQAIMAKKGMGRK